MLSIAEADPTNLTAAIGDGGNDISMLQVEEIASTTSTEEDVVYITVGLIKKWSKLGKIVFLGSFNTKKTCIKMPIFEDNTKFLISIFQTIF